MCSGDIRADIGADRIMITPALSQMVIGATLQARNVLLSPRIRLCWCLQQSTTVTNDSCLYMLPFVCANNPLHAVHIAQLGASPVLHVCALQAAAGASANLGQCVRAAMRAFT